MLMTVVITLHNSTHPIWPTLSRTYWKMLDHPHRAQTCHYVMWGYTLVRWRCQGHGSKQSSLQRATVEPEGFLQRVPINWCVNGWPPQCIWWLFLIASMISPRTITECVSSAQASNNISCLCLHAWKLPIKHITDSMWKYATDFQWLQ
jgi:hypothetical protein